MRTLKLTAMLLAAGATLAAPTVLHADTDEAAADRGIASDAFTYQGRLNLAGVPANGNFDFVFSVFTAPLGGVQVGPNVAVSNLAVAQGLFTTQLNFGNIFNGSGRYLQIRVRPAGVGSYQTLTPRQAITPSPMALFAENGGSVRNLQDAYEGGAVIDTTTGPAVQIIGPEPEIAGFEYYVDGIAFPVLRMFNHAGAYGGAIGFHQDDGPEYAFIEPDVQGDGGYLLVRRNGGSTGFVVDGNSGGSEEPFVQVDGLSTDVIFNMTTATPNNQVVLPNDSINSAEIGNETGAASTTSGGSTFLTGGGTIDTVATRTITAPSSGYVLVLGSAEVTLTHTTGSTTNVNFGVSDLTTSLPSNQDLEVRLDPDMPTGSYDFPVTAHGLFSVSAGANQFNILAQEFGGQIIVQDWQLTCVFIPTAYGTVTGTDARDFVSLPDEQAPVYAPMNAQDLAVERQVSLQADLDRLQRELREVRDLVETLERDVTND